MKDKEFEKYIKAVEGAVDHVAFVRRSAEVVGIDMEKFDEQIDVLCKKYHDKYANMDELELALTSMMEIVKAGHGDELVADLVEMFKE